jgi:16S rRNA (adenine1518-N6/adenine1519-N6)-dimethyltransferase
MKHKPKLGQNFLADDAARYAIVDALGDVSERTVIEIGPGRGAGGGAAIPFSRAATGRDR